MVSDAKDELRSEIRTDSEVNALIDTKITAFDQSLDRVTGGQLTTAVNAAKTELISQLLDSGEATTIVNTKIDEFSASLTYEESGVAATLVSDAKDDHFDLKSEQIPKSML